MKKSPISTQEATSLVLGKIRTETQEGGSLHGRSIERGHIDRAMTDVLREKGVEISVQVRYQIVNNIFDIHPDVAHGTHEPVDADRSEGKDGIDSVPLDRDRILDKVRDVLVFVLGVDDDGVTLETKLAEDLGAWGQRSNIHFNLQVAFNVEFSEQDFVASAKASDFTVKDIVDYMQTVLAANKPKDTL